MQPGQGAEVASRTMFTAAAAANAIPVAGQVASAFLAIGAGLVKAFGGKRRRREAAAQKRRQEFASSRRQETAPQAPMGQPATIGGQQAPQQMVGAAPVAAPQSPTFQNYDNPGQEPTVQPQRLGMS